MLAVSQICDAKLTNIFKFGENLSSSDIIEILRKVNIAVARDIENILIN